MDNCLTRLSRPFLFALALLALHTTQAEELEIFDLRGATPGEMIPLVHPFVGPDGTVTGMHNRLIVRTSPERMVEVRRIVQEFDRAPRRLLIHVRDRAPSEMQLGRIELSVDQPHLQIGETEKNSLSAKHYSTQSLASDRRSVQTLEGQPTLISSGIMRPEITRGAYVIGPHGGYETSIDYRTIDSGFYATVQLVGDRVRIEIDTRRQSPVAGSPVIRHQSTASVVSGRLGEWLPLAGIETRQQSGSSGIGARAGTEAGRQSDVWVMVELLPE